MHTSDMSLIHRVALVQRVASNHVEAVSKQAGPDGKLVGDKYRLTWSRHGFKLEELPAKGKKKLDVSTFQFPPFNGGMSFMIPENLLHWAKLDSNDSVDEVKKKLKAAWATGIKKAKAGDFGDRDKDMFATGKIDYMEKVEWYGKQVYFLEVEPEGVEPFSAEGKDFSVTVKWTEFSAYDPKSDMQLSDPHYTYYGAKSPQGARKLYQILKADPKALSGVSWSDFGDWLNKQGVPYKPHHSNW